MEWLYRCRWWRQRFSETYLSIQTRIDRSDVLLTRRRIEIILFQARHKRQHLDEAWKLFLALDLLRVHAYNLRTLFFPHGRRTRTSKLPPLLPSAAGCVLFNSFRIMMHYVQSKHISR